MVYDINFHQNQTKYSCAGLTWTDTFLFTTTWRDMIHPPTEHADTLILFQKPISLEEYKVYFQGFKIRWDLKIYYRRSAFCGSLHHCKSIYNSLWIHLEEQWNCNACKYNCCFMLVSCLAYSSTLKMEVTGSTKTSGEFHQTTRHYTKRTEFFITTAMRISYPILSFKCCKSEMAANWTTVFSHLLLQIFSTTSYNSVIGLWTTPYIKSTAVYEK
jgi:hypothetical protein